MTLEEFRSFVDYLAINQFGTGVGIGPRSFCKL